ncbi:MAG: hypothetical protein J4432_01855 [DPANN group archaeon]|nr:hypothetical protein [DPANN group archaeon]
MKTAILSIESAMPGNFEAIMATHDLLRNVGISKYAYLVRPGIAFLDNLRYVDFLKNSGQELVLQAPKESSRFPFLIDIGYRDAMHELGHEAGLFHLLFDKHPRGFIPNSWIHNARTEKALEDLDFSFTVTRDALIDLRNHKRIPCSFSRLPGIAMENQNAALLHLVVDVGAVLNQRIALQKELGELGQHCDFVTYSELLSL